MVEERYGSSPSVAPCTNCLTALVEHTPGRLEATGADIAGVAVAVIVGSSIAPVGNVDAASTALLDLGTELVGPDTGLTALSNELVAPGIELGTQVGIGDTSAPSVLVEPRPVSYCQ